MIICYGDGQNSLAKGLISNSLFPGKSEFYYLDMVPGYTTNMIRKCIVDPYNRITEQNETDNTYIVS